jgi:hypothetical protein
MLYSPQNLIKMSDGLSDKALIYSEWKVLGFTAMQFWNANILTGDNWQD